jgi:hypothetical protein
MAGRPGQPLVDSIDRTGGPRRWARELGLPLRHQRGHRWSPETIAVALKPLLAGRRAWPNRREFETAGLGGLYAAISRTEGHPTMAERYVLPLQRPRQHRTDPHRSS